MKAPHDSSSISFTAHYTGYVWQHYGLSAPAFATTQGRLYYQLLRPFEFLARRLIGSDIKTTLLQRHALLDRELERLLSQHPDLQILEIACGLSPRGYRFIQTHPGLRYIEADLPGMLARKRQCLAALGPIPERHRLVTCNILDHEGEHTLEAVIARECDIKRPLVIITEGLVNYFSLPTISRVWARMAQALRAFPLGAYFTDYYPEVDGHRAAGLIRQANSSLRLASRSSFCLHFARDDSAVRHFLQLGFSQAQVLNPDQEAISPQAQGGAIVRVLLAQA